MTDSSVAARIISSCLSNSQDIVLTVDAILLSFAIWHTTTTKQQMVHMCAQGAVTIATVHLCVGSGHRSNCTFVCREWSLQQLYTYVQGVVAVATIFSVAYCSNYNDRLPISSGVCAQNTVECTRACVGSGCYINGILITHCPTSNCNDRLGSHSKHIVTASWF